MKNIMVIPDVHCRKFWQEAVEENIDKVDKIIFLGDYVDPYPAEYEENPDLLYDSPIECLADIIMLKQKLGDKCILLLGNHIDHYIWTNFPVSSRFNRFKGKEYNDLLLDNLNLFNLVWIENDVIFSHAGITNFWAEEVWDKLEFPKDELVSIIEIAECLKDTPLKNFNREILDLIGYVGFYRGGIEESGSCEWADIHDHFTRNNNDETVPVKYEDCYQVFGHTQLKEHYITDTWACLDCRKAFIIDVNTHEISKC